MRMKGKAKRIDTMRLLKQCDSIIDTLGKQTIRSKQYFEYLCSMTTSQTVFIEGLISNFKKDQQRLYEQQREQLCALKCNERIDDGECPPESPNGTPIFRAQGA